MPKTVNEIVNDEIIGHSLDLNSLELQMKRDAVKQLKALAKTLIQDLEKANILNGKPMTKFKQKRLKTLLKQTEETIKSAYKQVKLSHADELVAVAGIAEAQTVKALNTAVKVELVSTAISKTALASIAKNTLIEGAPSKEWWARRSQAFTNKFTDTVRQGMLRGDTTDSIVRSLRGTKSLKYKDSVLNGNYRSAEALVRTSIQTVANEARLQTYADNDDIIKEIVWQSTLDSRTSSTCMALDGLRWKNPSREPIGHNIAFVGSTAHWNCRSTTIGITRSWKELGAKGKFKEIPTSTRASMDGQVSDKKSYESWLKEKPVKFQKEVLGVEKHKLWKEKKLGFTDMVSGSGQPLTLEQLKNKLSI
jgi:SPP1 gp7 family putative phage head morphogenesis protein